MKTAKTVKTLKSSLLSEQSSLDRIEKALALEVTRMMKGLEDKLLANILKHSPADFKNLTTRQRHLEALLSEARNTIADTFDAIHSLTNKQLVLTIKTTADRTNEILSGFLKISSRRVSDEYAKKLASNAIVDGATQSEWWSNQAEIFRQRFTREMRQGLANGENMSKLVKRAKGVMDIPTRQAQTLVRTSTQTVAQQARIDQYRNNSDVISHIILSVTMDGRESDECRPRDGKAYTLEGEPIGHSIPFDGGPPYHFNCRTQAIPVTKPLNPRN